MRDLILVLLSLLVGGVLGAHLLLVLLRTRHNLAMEAEAQHNREARDDMHRAAQSMRLDLEDVRREARRALKRANATLTAKQGLDLVEANNSAVAGLRALEAKVEEVHAALRNGSLAEMMEARR